MEGTFNSSDHSRAVLQRQYVGSRPKNACGFGSSRPRLASRVNHHPTALPLSFSSSHHGYQGPHGRHRETRLDLLPRSTFLNFLSLANPPKCQMFALGAIGNHADQRCIWTVTGTAAPHAISKHTMKSFAAKTIAIDASLRSDPISPRGNLVLSRRTGIRRQH